MKRFALKFRIAVFACAATLGCTAPQETERPSRVDAIAIEQALVGRWTALEGNNQSLEFWPGGQFTEIAGPGQRYGVWRLAERDEEMWIQFHVGRVYVDGGFRDEASQTNRRLVDLDEDSLALASEGRGEDEVRYRR